jgi:hypothetical protein
MTRDAKDDETMTTLQAEIVLRECEGIGLGDDPPIVALRFALARLTAAEAVAKACAECLGGNGFCPLCLSSRCTIHCPPTRVPGGEQMSEAHVVIDHAILICQGCNGKETR